MSLYDIARAAFIRSKQLKGQKTPENDEVVGIAEAWENAFLNAGVTEQQVIDAVKDLESAGESITYNSIIGACKTSSNATNRDFQAIADQEALKTVLGWSNASGLCPSLHPYWTGADRARELGFPLQPWADEETQDLLREFLHDLPGYQYEDAVFATRYTAVRRVKEDFETWRAARIASKPTGSPPRYKFTQRKADRPAAFKPDPITGHSTTTTHPPKTKKGKIMANDWQFQEFTLCQDPELGTGKNGTPYAKLNLVCSTSYKDKQGNWQNVDTLFIKTMVWDENAKTVKNCRKGTHVILKFKWVTNKWQDKEGKERSVNEPRVKMLIPLPDTRPAQPQQPQQQAYDPWNSQPADFGANNGFDNPPF